MILWVTKRIVIPVDCQMFEQFLVQAIAGDLVESAEGLVHQQDARTRQQRARDRDALPLSARKLMRIGVLPTRRAPSS